MPDSKENLVNLIDYVRHMAEIGDKPIFAIKEYKSLAYRESELRNRIGISHDLNDEDGAIWLKIDRLTRTDPPQLPESLLNWLKISRDPLKAPTVNAVHTETIPKEEADKLVKIGTLLSEDVQKALRYAESLELCDAIFRLERLPEIKQSIDDYIQGPWLAWQQTEVPRRETIAIYDALFGIDQTIQTEGTEQPLEIVWGVGVTRWRVGGYEIDHPLIEQLVELHVDTVSGAITIRPRSTEPQVALKPYMALENPGADLVLQFSTNFFINPTENQEFSPYQSDSFESILRHAATHLDTTGVYLPDIISDLTNRDVPDPTTTLTVSDSWAIYVRRRSDNFFISDLNKLKQAVNESEQLPGPADRLVVEPTDTGGYVPTIINIGRESIVGFHTGVGGSSGGGSITSVETSVDSVTNEDFFFPKPFNDEQVSIIKRLCKADGVVVQGPPGTGKTHTIANIICHYLATGRRVLVTSKGEAALSVLRDHIPEGIRELVISLLTNEREGLKQLERAVSVLANMTTQINPFALEQDIHSRQQKILKLQNKMNTLNAEIQQWADKHLKPVGKSKDKNGYLPMELAEKLIKEREQHSWFPDTIKPNAKPLFTEEDIAEVITARKNVAIDLPYIDIELPSPNDLPDSARIGAIHEDLANARRLELDANTNHVPMLSFTNENALGRAETLLHSIEKVLTSHQLLKERPWLSYFFKTWLSKGVNADETRLFVDILEPLNSIVAKRTELVMKAIEIPTAALTDHKVVEAIDKAAAGNRPFWLLPFGKAIARGLFDQIKIAARKPSSEEEWKQISEYVQWRNNIQSFVAKWASLSAEYGLPELIDQGDTTGRWLDRLDRDIKQMRSVITDEAQLIRSEIPILFPYGLEAENVLLLSDNTESAIKIIKQNLSRYRLNASRKHITELASRLDGSGELVTSKIRVFITQAVGNPDNELPAITDSWQGLIQELNRVIGLRSHLELIASVSNAVKESGAIKWAERLRTDPVVGIDDPWTPSTWRKSWDWARLNSYLHEIDGRVRIRALTDELTRADNELKKVFAEVVKLRTHLGLKKNITERVASALVMFTSAIRSIGKGTGVRARRFRRNAKDAMERSYSAVPCWIMPTWRVSESLPPVLGSFDLVIVDEASQSDIAALPTILRASKVLVVGDDKQVSPTAAFIEERKILQLQHNYLQGQPFSAAVLPGSSLYSLAQAMFPGDRVLLREHFRCVEPIIRFCFQFYNEPLIPLRVPNAKERLDPPLIDIYVPHGQKDRRQINVAEAEAIVEEIDTIVKDATYSDRTIGVVSLIGAKQAHYVQSLLLERIGDAAFMRHQIACGDSATFQGKERDIMFISMVDSPQSKSAKTSIVFQQRFNVALSRARDRQYLVRSVTEEMLNPEDLKAKVIQHFKSPMLNQPSDIREQIELCDSDFERDVYTRLTNLGYKVIPQVHVGLYSIDLVVEGVDDRRLAIELDGDKYHGPERWADDLSRQRVLERVGWRFWRCWGSSFTLDPDGCMDDLVSTLTLMEISPIGAMTSPVVYTEHRVVTRPNELEQGAEEHQTAMLVAEAVNSLSMGNLADIETSQANKTGQGQEVPRGTEEQDEELFIQPGDRVLISYNDEPERQYTFSLSRRSHDPDHFIINAEKPLAQALMGYSEEDEVDIPAGGETRKVTILKVERPEAAVAIAN